MSRREGPPMSSKANRDGALRSRSPPAVRTHCAPPRRGQSRCRERREPPSRQESPDSALQTRRQHPLVLAVVPAPCVLRRFAPRRPGHDNSLLSWQPAALAFPPLRTDPPKGVVNIALALQTKTWMAV